MKRIAFVFLLLCGFTSLQAEAHAILVEAAPAEEAKVEPPDIIELRFDAPVGQQFLAVAVIDDKHRRVDRGDAARDVFDPSVVRVHLLEALPVGEYWVRYRVQSADGHIVTGRYHFTVVGKSNDQDQNSVVPSWVDRLVHLFADR